MGCLYILRFPNGKAYVGISRKSAEDRYATHRIDARMPQWAHLPLYRAIRKHGDPLIETLALCDDWKQLQEMERAAIVRLGTRSPNGYNATDGGEGRAFLGRKHSASSIEKIRAAQIGVPKKRGWRHTEEAKQKIGASHLGTRHSEESKAKMRKAAEGRTFSEETRRKISEAGKGRKLTENQLRALHTPEVRARRNAAISAAPRKINTSGTVGVCFDKARGKWVARLMISRRTINLGRFETIEDAIAARRAAALLRA